jgi:hypothetical protein
MYDDASSPRLDLSFLTMLKENAFLAFKDDSIACCAATVLCTLTGSRKILLPSPSDLLPKESKKRSKAVLGEQHLRFLSSLRLQGFRGAVIVLSPEPFSDLRAQHRILRWGHGSHDACKFPLAIEDLLFRVDKLLPLQAENFRMLQAELKSAPNDLLTRVTKSLVRLQKSAGKDRQAVKSIDEEIQFISEHTPVAFHADVRIGGRNAQLQEHLRLYLAETRTDWQLEKGIDGLKKTFEAWRDIVSES